MLPMIWCRKQYSRLGQRVSGFRLAPTCARGRLSFCATIIFRKCGGPAFEENGTILPPTGFWPPRQGRTSKSNYPICNGRSWNRSEEHTSELQSLMRITYAVFCLKKKNKIRVIKTT